MRFAESSATPEPQETTPSTDVVRPSVETSVTDQPPKQKVALLWTICAVAVIALILFGTNYKLVTEPIANFTEEFEEIVVTRDIPNKAEAPEWKEEITPEKVRSITHGKGLKLILLTKENGKRKNRTEEILIPSVPAPNPGPRKKLLADAKDTVTRRVEALNSIEIPIVKFAIFVDSTSGDLELLNKQLELQLNADLVEQTTKKGYAVKVFFHRLSSTPSYVPNLVGTVEIPVNAAPGTGQQEISEKREQIAKNLKRDKASALVGGILNAIYEDGLTAGDHVLVFSDGLECCRILNWENGDPSDVTPDKWDGIFQKMEAAVPNVPVLARLHIDWYLPSREEKLDMMNASIKVWKAFFQQRGKVQSFREHQ
jgi:hypothetical protein